MQSWLAARGFWWLAAFAATGGVLWALSSPPGGPPYLLWFGFIPLTLVARVCGKLSRRRRFFIGVCGGLGVGLIGFPWIAETLIRFAQFPWALAVLGLLLFSLWTALPVGFWMVGASEGPRTGKWGIIWPIALYVGLFRVWPSVFPFTPLIGMAQVPEWIQLAEFGGVALCETHIALAGVLAADGLFQREARARWIRFAIAASIPVLSYGYGSVRIAALHSEAESARSVKIGIIQPNVPLMMRRVREKMRRLRSQSQLAQSEGAQLVVWPEAGAFPYSAFRPVEKDFNGRRRVLKEHRLPTIFGIATRDKGGKYEYNTVLMMNEHGRVTGSFDKVELVPFGEYIPIVDPDWARRQIPAMSHNNAGLGPARFEIALQDDGPFHAGPLICYEDIFDVFARDVARQRGGIELFVNVTIDTWFGDTAEPWEHLALAQFRSVEHRIPMVRSVSAGTSSFVDHTGAIAAALPVRPVSLQYETDPERLVVDVKLPRNTAHSPTIYASFGWLYGWLCSIGVAVTVLAAWWRRKYSPRAS